MQKPVLTLLSASLVLAATQPVAAQNEPDKKGLLLGKSDPSLLLGKPDPELLLGKPDPTKDASAIKNAPEVPNDPTSNVAVQDACPTPVQGGEAAADWRPPPIPPKEARDGGGKAAADWRPPPIPPKEANDAGRVADQGGNAASDWRPPPIPPLVAQNGAACAPQAAESADWRPPPIPPK